MLTVLMRWIRAFFATLYWVIPPTLQQESISPILASLLARIQIISLFAVGTPQQYIDLRRSFTRRPRPPPIPPLPPPPPRTSNMSTSDDAGYSGTLRSSTRLNQETQGKGREGSRSRDSRRGGPPDENPGDDSDTNTSGHAQGIPTVLVDSLVHVEEAGKPPPGAGASRRQVSPASGEHHDLTSSQSTEHHRRHLDSTRSTERLRQSSGDRGTRVGPSESESEITRAQRALDDASATLHRREKRRRRHDKDVEQAKTTAREAFLVLERAR